MSVRVVAPCFTVASCASVAALLLGCGGTTLSHDDRTGGSGGSGAGAGGGQNACPLSHEGDLVVRTPAELEALRDHRLVDGDLIVDCPECTSLEPLGCLEEVGKMLSIVGCDRLESLEGLSALRRVGLLGDNGGLGIGFFFVPWPTSGNARLRTLDGLGPIEAVDGRIDVRKNPELRDLSALSGMSYLAGSLYVDDNDALASLEDLSELESTRGALHLTDNDALVDLAGLGSFAEASGLNVSENDQLVTLGGLDGFWGRSADLAVEIVNNPLLADVTALKNLSGTLRSVSFRGNASLGEVSLGSYVEILSGSLSVADNTTLRSFTVPGLTHVGQAIHIERNPVLEVLDIGAPVNVLSVAFVGNDALRDTTPFAALRLVSDYVFVEDNALLSQVTLPELQEVLDLRIQGNPALTSFDLDALRSAERISIAYNENLPSCLVEELLASVPSMFPFECGNAADACAIECPPRP
jgi:hypothetical protein